MTKDLNNLNATRVSVAAEGLTEANLNFCQRQKCKQVLVPLPEKNGNRDAITVLFNEIHPCGWVKSSLMMKSSLRSDEIAAAAGGFNFI